MTDVLGFFSYLILFILLPVVAMGKLWRWNFRVDIIESLFITGMVGVLLNIGLTIIVRSLGLPFFFLWGIPAVSLLFLIKQIKHPPRFPSFRLQGFYFLILLLIGVSSFVQSMKLLPGGIKNSQGYGFVDLHDTMWNIAITEELADTFPPKNFAYSGVQFKNNHFYYQLFLASIHALTGISVIPLYYRIAPLFTAFLFGTALYSTIKIYSANRYTIGLGIFLGYFTGNFAYLLPLVFRNATTFSTSAFMADQPFDQLVNPYTVLGFSVFLFIAYAVWQSRHGDKGIWALWAVLAGGLLFGIKAYGGIVVMIALFVTGIFEFFFFRTKDHGKIFLLTLPLFIVTFLMVSEPGKNSLHWAPGWLLSEMMIGQDKLNYPDWVMREDYFRSIGNYWSLFVLKMRELTIYLVGNLNVRLLGIGTLFLLKKSSRKTLTTSWFFLIAACIALAIPLLFNQGANAYNIVQFTPYALIALTILSIPGIDTLRVFTHRKFGIIGVAGLYICLISMATNSTVKEVQGYFAPESRLTFISDQEITAIEFLREYTKRDDIIMVDSSRKLFVYLPALAKRRLLLLDKGFAIQTGNDPGDRELTIKMFFTGDRSSDMMYESLLRQHGVRYIYLLGIYPLFVQERLKSIGFKPVFTNSEVVIYGKLN